jgi:hypothetical protein
MWEAAGFKKKASRLKVRIFGKVVGTHWLAMQAPPPQGFALCRNNDDWSR